MLPQLEIASPRTEIIPERKFDEACFLKFSPCFSVKFAHFGEHFSLKTPMECVYVCLYLHLLISLHFIQKFTRKLHCLHQITTPLFPLYLDIFPFSVWYISKVAIISKVTRYDYNLTIMKWSLPNQIMCFLLPVDSKPTADKMSVNNQKLPLKSNNVEFLRYCGGHFENGDREKFFDVRNQFRTS
jgi:hypothetical protein